MNDDVVQGSAAHDPPTSVPSAIGLLHDRECMMWAGLEGAIGDVRVLILSSSSS
jgi:hypothetical protein